MVLGLSEYFDASLPTSTGIEYWPGPGTDGSAFGASFM